MTIFDVLSQTFSNIRLHFRYNDIAKTIATSDLDSLEDLYNSRLPEINKHGFTLVS